MSVGVSRISKLGFGLMRLPGKGGKNTGYAADPVYFLPLLLCGLPGGDQDSGCVQGFEYEALIS